MAEAQFAPGAHVEVRDEVWRVERVDDTSSGGKALRVVGLSELVRDKAATFLTEYERDVRVLRPEETRIVPDTSGGYRLSLLYMESMLRRIAPTDNRLHIGHRAAMDVMDYQLRPAAQILAQPRQRMLIADAVGLGKTLEAGIVLSELIARGRGRRILVVGVKSMLGQLQKEFWGRFGIGLVRLDSVGLQRIRAQIPTHHNPFHHFDRAIISIDTLKQNNAFARHLEQARWDVIVIDEAHNVAHRGKGRRSQRARLADLLATRSDALLMLSATPHDGRARSFASLMNMLDPTAIADEERYKPQEVAHLFVRRFKKDVVHELARNFPERVIEKVYAQASAPEEAAYAAFASLDFKALDQRGGQHLFKTALEKALLSSPAACAQTVRERLRKLAKRIERREQEPSGAGGGGATAQAMRADAAALEAFLERLEAVQAEDFAKFQELLAVIKKRFKWKASRKDDRLVIFTERIETLKFLGEHLSAFLGLRWGGYGRQDVGKDQILALDGSMSDVEQQQVVEAFGRDKAKVRILVASDVASEGINLHYLSHKMIHFDIPWSLMVFQQRNGRVDRYGQTHRPHLVYLLTTSDNDKIEGDKRVLDVLIEKDEQVQKNIGDPCAFGGHTVEEQEEMTAAAMASGDVDDFMSDLFNDALFGEDDEGDVDTSDLFGSLFEEDGQEGAGQGGAVDAGAVVETASRVSLFESDYDYLVQALGLMRQHKAVSFDADPSQRRVELTLTPNLRRRLVRAVDREVIPADDLLLLCADPDKIQEDIKRTRGQEGQWPALHYLWPLHPVMGWVADHMSGALGRHSAPLLHLDQGLGPGQSVMVMSALVPNRRSQPVLHQWYAVWFDGPQVARVEDFQDFVRAVGLGADELVSRELDPQALEAQINTLQALIPEAVKEARQQMVQRQQGFASTLEGQLAHHTERLAQLRTQKLAALQARVGSSTRAADKARRDVERFERIFAEHQRWVKDTMTTEPEPFIQVIAALVPSVRPTGA